MANTRDGPSMGRPVGQLSASEMTSKSCQCSWRVGGVGPSLVFESRQVPRALKLSKCQNETEQAHSASKNPVILSFAREDQCFVAICIRICSYIHFRNHLAYLAVRQDS